METSNKLFAVSSLLNILAFINPQALLMFFSIVSVLITISHNGLKLYRDWKGKKVQ